MTESCFLDDSVRRTIGKRRSGAIVAAETAAAQREGEPIRLQVSRFVEDAFFTVAQSINRATATHDPNALGEGTFICCGALWTPSCHLPCHVTVL